MQIDPLTALLQSIKSVLDQALPTDLAHSVGRDIESRLQSALKSLSLVPKQQFEAQETLLATLEAQIESLEKRLAKLEGTDAADR
ncbi:MAG: accessory factor UbiK family protein [Pseudomonadales bacterium]|nr:accessory factor UbiK family protein [Pseudomonadales bacterium]